MKYVKTPDVKDLGGSKMTEMAELKLRNDQIPVVDEIIKNFRDGYKVIALNASTGVGKSPILMSVIKQFGDGYTTTPLRTLVNQYRDTITRFPDSEFGWVVMGRGAYPCPHLQSNEEMRFAKIPDNKKSLIKHEEKLKMMTADGAPCTRHDIYKGEFFVGDGNGDIGEKKEYVKGCPKFSGCPYFLDRKKAMDANNAIMTLDYFLRSPVKDILKENENGWQPRKVLVIDEAHFLSSKLADVYSITVTERSYPGFDYKIVMKNIEEKRKVMKPTDNFSEIVIEEFRKEFEVYELQQEEIMKDLEILQSSGSNECNYHGKIMSVDDAIQKHTKLLYKLMFVAKIIRNDIEFVYSHDDNGFYLKPYTPKSYLQPIWEEFDYIILSSATLFDVPSYLEELGLDKYKWKQIDVSAPFNPENGPIFQASHLYLSMKNYDSTIDGVVKRIDEILEEHTHERGIIHCFSEKYRKAIYEKTQNKKRMVIHDSFNRQEVLKKFTTNVPDGDNMVLLSVNMGEGVDLKDDLSRFQIIVKCPFLPMGDPWIRLHKDRSDRWYKNQAIISLMQMSGRVVRSEEDFGYTYIIDGNGWNLLQTNREELEKHHSWFTARMDAGTRQKNVKIEKERNALVNDILGD